MTSRMLGSPLLVACQLSGAAPSIVLAFGPFKGLTERTAIRLENDVGQLSDDTSVIQLFITS